MDAGEGRLMGAGPRRSDTLGLSQGHGSWSGPAWAIRARWEGAGARGKLCEVEGAGQGTQGRPVQRETSGRSTRAGAAGEARA